MHRSDLGRLLVFASANALTAIKVGPVIQSGLPDFLSRYVNGSMASINMVSVLSPNLNQWQSLESLNSQFHSKFIVYKLSA